MAQAKAADAIDGAALDHARALGLEPVGSARPALPHDAPMAVLHAEAAACFERLTLDDDAGLLWQEAGAWPNGFREARFLSAVDLVGADRPRSLVMRDTDEPFGEGSTPCRAAASAGRC